MAIGGKDRQDVSTTIPPDTSGLRVFEMVVGYVLEITPVSESKVSPRGEGQRNTEVASCASESVVIQAISMRLPRVTMISSGAVDNRDHRVGRKIQLQRIAPVAVFFPSLTFMVTSELPSCAGSG